jgi:hypothetical protein
MQFYKALSRKGVMMTVLLMGCWASSVLSASAQTYKLSVTLILASNEAGKPDPALAKIVPKLKKTFGFTLYKKLGGGRATLAVPGNATLNLGQGYSLKVNGQPAGKGAKASMQLLRNGKVVMKPSAPLKKGGPIVLGGLNHGNGKIILVIQVL